MKMPTTTAFSSSLPYMKQIPEFSNPDHNFRISKQMFKIQFVSFAINCYKLDFSPMKDAFESVEFFNIMYKKTMLSSHPERVFPALKR
jgi:hypothetical protein